MLRSILLTASRVFTNHSNHHGLRTLAVRHNLNCDRYSSHSTFCNITATVNLGPAPPVGIEPVLPNIQQLHIATTTKKSIVNEANLSLSVPKSPCLLMASLQMDPAMRSHGASDKEFADQGEQNSILSQCGSWSSPSIASVDLSELQSLQNPIGVPFETYAQQLGSHLAYDNRRSETLDMFLDLELCKIHRPLFLIYLTAKHSIESNSSIQCRGLGRPGTLKARAIRATMCTQPWHPCCCRPSFH